MKLSSTRKTNASSEWEKVEKKSELFCEEHLVKFVGGPATEMTAALADVWCGGKVTSRPTPDPSSPLLGLELQA